MAIFIYKNIKAINIQEIYIIGSLNGCQHNRDKLHKVGDKWCIEIDLPEGIYFYKYVINRYIKLNDPMSEKYALDEHNEMWSIVTIRNNKKSNALLRNNRSILKYMITNRVLPDIEENKTQKNISFKMDRKVCLGMKLKNQAGLQQVTVLWYEPTMHLYHICEHTFDIAGYENGEFQTKWFWLDLNGQGVKCLEGVWIIRVFINGHYEMQDYFRLSHELLFRMS